MTLRAVVFDLDGTLIDSYAPIADSLNYAAVMLGHPPLDPSQVRHTVGRGLEFLVARVLEVDADNVVERDRIVEGVKLFREHYDRTCELTTRLLPGVAATLSRLRMRGYRMAVATNKASHFSRRLLDALGVGACLAAVIGPDQVAHQKPHPEMIEMALAALGVRREEALYVGDMEVDVQTARAAGLPVVLVPTGSCS